MIVVVEGIDGCGKTEVTKALADLLSRKQAHLQVAQVAFPNRASPTGRVIDELLRQRTSLTEAEAYTHQALQVVNRLELLAELEREDRLNVLSRYTPSAFVYGGLDGCGTEWLGRVTRALPPADLQVLLKCDPETAYLRMRARGVTADQYERRGVAWFREAERRYEQLWVDQDTLQDGSHDERGTVWLQLATDDPPAVLAQRLADFVLTQFQCRCGWLHNELRTPCRDEEVDHADEE